jgi:hypothetical protein
MKNIIPTSFSSSNKQPIKQNTFHKYKHNPNNSNQILNITNNNNENICSSLDNYQCKQTKNIPLHKTETTKSISSTEEQPTPKQIPKVFVSQSSFTSRETKITTDTDSSLVYNRSFTLDNNDTISHGILESLVYPSHDLTINETRVGVEKAQMFIKKVTINEENEISPLKIILGEDTRTMIVMKNIPLNYKPKEVLDDILRNEYINGRFNFFYLPYNETKKENFGFALINFIHPFHVIYFYEMYYKKYPKKFTPKKQKKFELFYADYYDDINDSFSKIEKEFVLPNKYYDIFKDVYRKSVCVIKEKTFTGDGVFIVKSLGKMI